MVSQDEIHGMAHSEDVKERNKAADQLYHDFAVLPDKEQAWNDFLYLSKDSNVIWTEPNALGSAFLHAPNKDRAWNDIIACTDKSNNINTRIGFSFALGSAFPYITDKEQGLNDILKLTTDSDETVKSNATYSLGSAFPYVLNKGKAWEALIRLTQVENNSVRWRAAESLAPAFPHMLDKEQASKDILFLSNKKDKIVLNGIAKALDSVFRHVINKNEIWNVLLNLSANTDGFVRMSATYSLGQISIFKATIAKSESRFYEELENAIEFFENSLLEGVFNNPAEFCLLFYRSFHAITSNKKDVEAEIEINLSEARDVVWGSESREKLLEVLEKLSSAIKEVQSIHEMDLETRKRKLYDVMQYLEHVENILQDTEEKAPIATNFLKIGASMVYENIKQTIAEIEEKSEVLCRQTQGTSYETLGKEVNQIGKDLIRDPISLEKNTISLEEVLSAICDKMSEEKGEACRLLEKVRGEQYIEDKLPLISMILSKIPMQLRMKDFEEKLDKMLISVQPTIQEKFEISTGIEIFGTGGKHIVTIPIQDISSPEVIEQLKSLSKENKTKLDALPTILKEKVKEYLMKKDIL